MEHKICEYQYCDNTFPLTTSVRKFCCRACKVKNKNTKKYMENKEFRESKKEKSNIKYKAVKEKYTKLAFLNEEQLETLKKIRPDWF